MTKQEALKIAIGVITLDIGLCDSILYLQIIGKEGTERRKKIHKETRTVLEAMLEEVKNDADNAKLTT